MRRLLGRVAPHVFGEHGDWRPAWVLVHRESYGRSSKSIDLGRKGVRTLEGWRVSTREGASTYDARVRETPIYRQANLSKLRFRLGREHFRAPVIDEDWCVRPGDVVINKIAPLHAAVASLNLPRHPIDGNCLMVRGLGVAEAFWLALCLNHESYSAPLLGGSTLPRISLSGLRGVRAPQPPAAAEPLAAEAMLLNDEVLSNGESLARLVEEAEEFADDAGLLTSGPDTDSNSDPLRSGRFFPASDIGDSWLPMHVEVGHMLGALERIAGYLPVSSLAVSPEDDSQQEGTKLLHHYRVFAYTSSDLNPPLAATPARARLRGMQTRSRYLRLGDAGEDLTFSEPEEKEPVRWSFRLYREPLGSGEVLLSKLASNPRVVYVDARPEEKILVADHWERFRFRETPGAWALLLNTSVIRGLISRLANDKLHQFTNSESLRSIVLPPVPEEVRRAWEERLRAHHQRKRELEKRWKRLMDEAEALYARVHGAAAGGTS